MRGQMPMPSEKQKEKPILADRLAVWAMYIDEYVHHDLVQQRKKTDFSF
jgi:hypothetical protein